MVRRRGLEPLTWPYIRTRSCNPVFFTDFRRESSRAALSEMRYAFSDQGLDLVVLQNGLDMLESNGELREQVEAEFEAMNEEILRVAMEDPEYFAALQKIATLKATYQAARTARFGNDWAQKNQSHLTRYFSAMTDLPDTASSTHR